MTDEYVTYNKKPPVTIDQIRDKVLGSRDDSNFYPELSPQWSGEGKTLDTNDRPVRMFEPSSGNPTVATRGKLRTS